MGYKIVLTSDRTLMSDYNKIMFLGFAACFPKVIPQSVYELIFCPPVPHENGVVKFATCGLRKIEAALLASGFTKDEVVVAHPEHLDKLVDEDTKVLGISSNDPLGLGPASSTFSSLLNREPYTSIYFRKLITNKLIREYGLKVIVGGEGAWQLENEAIRKKLGIECLVIGEGELTAPMLFKKAINNEPLPSVIQGEIVPTDKIPLIANPTINGVVEIARGCGRGCKFCNPTMLRFRSLPLERIIEECKINLASGSHIILHAEDVLRYCAKGHIPEEEKVLELIETVRALTPNVGISHFALASALAKPTLIENISEILELGSRTKPWLSGQTGIETASPRLVSAHLKGKVKPFEVEKWPEVVYESFKLLADNNWVPCSTLILGMPGEQGSDTLETLKLMEKLEQYKSLIIPLFFVPIGIMKESNFFRKKNMQPEHWMLIAQAIKHNFKWIYFIADDMFKVKGTSLIKSGALRFIIKYFEMRVKPYVESMEAGKNPGSKYA